MKAATAVIHMAALNHNIEIIRAMAPNSRTWAAIKANGYGHGLLPVAKALSTQTDGFGVARLEEAVSLRKGGIENPILLLEGFFSWADLPALEAHNLQTAVHCIEQLEALEKATLRQPLHVWLKIDTGMHRLGVRPEHVSEFIERLNASPNVAKPLNFMSHFGCADELDKPVTPQQIALFNELTVSQPGYKSLAASSGSLMWPDSHFDFVRPGISLYGISPVAARCGQDFGLKPAMTMTSSLIAVREVKKGEAVGYSGRWVAERDTQLGVVAIGYGDGYPRVAPDGTPVLVNGRRVPLAGRVSMDMITVDLGPDSTDSVGDEVIMWGEGLPVEEIARHVGTIGYELVTNLTSRVHIVYQ
ncbi:alanine racemase [Grimontia hollisae]|uniref:Alanine racemase n=1 Tax=Grimontia hollisae CIP 101886 TaxID=675812 RepID=D0I8P6_GRIHO|nr:alanine racemase [Grimontia hollisae]AMG30883.1 alanine racemase [Grimontia hollisae]EEY73015.1 alanine racemase biosynthetic [Grimontia hollisae CIP 101886]STO47196.1 Alanine racemase, biosynthetic [Grimontia hollisae]